MTIKWSRGMLLGGDHQKLQREKAPRATPARLSKTRRQRKSEEKRVSRAFYLNFHHFLCDSSAIPVDDRDWGQRKAEDSSTVPRAELLIRNTFHFWSAFASQLVLQGRAAFLYERADKFDRFSHLIGSCGFLGSSFSPHGSRFGDRRHRRQKGRSVGVELLGSELFGFMVPARRSCKVEMGGQEWWRY